jgi:chemotaxis protein methyltransferase CheR
MNSTADFKLADTDLRAICKLVYEQSGISLDEGKRELVKARLQKRLRHHGLNSFREYLALVDNDRSGAELVVLLDSIATNHTHFFREAAHFDYLSNVVLPELNRRPKGHPVSIWCAAASTGEEPYTLAMTLLEAGCTQFSMLASDLSTKALASARSGVYRLDRLKGIPQPLLRKYFEKGLGEQAGLGRVGAELRRRIRFEKINLLEAGPEERNFDVIFCRNVMIYFDKIIQQRVVSMLETHLAPGGHMFISHSENLNGIDHQLKTVASAVFRSVA